MRTLVIDGTGRGEDESKTKYLANRVLDKLELDNVEFLDLYQIDIPFVTLDIIKSWTSNSEETQALKLLNQFENSDQVIFIYPTWNWSVPAIIRVYMDLIIISGRTFGYNEKGKSIGYLTEKKAILISTTGGKTYSRVTASLLKAQSGDNYMKQVLATIGIKQTTIYSIDNTAYDFNDENDKFDFAKYKNRVEEVCNKIT